MVSHDASLNYALADRVIVLDQGKVVKDSSKEEILEESKP